MSYSTPIKDRLDEKLNTFDFQTIKQGLTAYLAYNDPKVEGTQFTNGVMDEILPYLKLINPAWQTMQPGDLNTSWNAINSMYHSIRGQFRSLKNLRKGVQEYLEELEAESFSNNKEDQASLYPPKPDNQQNVVNDQIQVNEMVVFSTKSMINDASSSIHAGKDFNPQGFKSYHSVQPYISLDQDIIRHSCHYAEYKELYAEIQARQRDLESAERKMQDLQSIIIGLSNPYDDQV